MPYPPVTRFLAALISLLAAFSEANAAEGAWKKHLFDFNNPSLNFETDVPGDATVETVTMEDAEPGSIGRVKIVGKVTPGANGQQVETTVLAYDLLSPPAALRICRFETELDGYTPRSLVTSPDLTEATVFATQSEKGKPKGGILSHCVAKGKNALSIHFVVKVSGEPTREMANRALEELDNYSETFLRNLQFSDGKQANFGDDMQSVPLHIGERKIDLQIPTGWEIPINDFQGPLPAELHMIRRSRGQDVGLIWLFVQPMAEKPDMEKKGAEIIRNYFVKQTSGADAPVLLGTNENSALSEQGLTNREFRFSVKTLKGEDIGVIDATAVWKDSQLAVISEWSTWTQTARRNEFFSRLPGMTAYDLVRSAVLGIAL
ncbi:hypothetical protein FS827_25360 [Agrobacterium vitis]|uniref:hypothetical protein n=1 Tax=Allorhizobium ampelinum TaxID=3025782 RepID=UPI001F39B51E|nr:hypothetical protein [Allorhizobium ampelinum]MCF1464613.1 hypothetical protein [Allorhizobium ampelinum]